MCRDVLVDDFLRNWRLVTLSRDFGVPSLGQTVNRTLATMAQKAASLSTPALSIP